MSAEWKLNLEVFQQIMSSQAECSIDLFVSQLNPQYVGLRPNPNVMATDALKLQWNKWIWYAFPLFCLIRRCLKKVRGGQFFAGVGSSTMKVPTMVLGPAVTPDRLPHDPPRVPTLADGPLQ